MSVEQYWPPEILAAVFPGEYRGAEPRPESAASAASPVEAESVAEARRRYTAERLAGGCMVYRLAGPARSPR